MKRTISSKTLSKIFLMAVIALTAGSVHAQSSDEKPIQSERVGVETADAMPLTLNEAIRFALETNNDIRTSRIDVEKAEYNLTASRGAYDPKIFSESYFERLFFTARLDRFEIRRRRWLTSAQGWSAATTLGPKQKWSLTRKGFAKRETLLAKNARAARHQGNGTWHLLAEVVVKARRAATS